MANIKRDLAILAGLMSAELEKQEYLELEKIPRIPFFKKNTIKFNNFVKSNAEVVFDLYGRKHFDKVIEMAKEVKNDDAKSEMEVMMNISRFLRSEATKEGIYA